MATSWRFVGRVLVVTESGTSSNDEIELAQSEVPKVVGPLPFAAFTDEAEATSWLEA